MLGVISRELGRLEAALHEPQTADRYCQLYAAQQALAWALEPNGIAAPYDAIQRGRVQPPTDTQADSADCWAHTRQPSS